MKHPSAGSAKPDPVQDLLYLLYSMIWAGSQFAFSHYENRRRQKITPADANTYRLYKSNFDAVFEASEILFYVLGITLLTADHVFARDCVDSSKGNKFHHVLSFIGFTQTAFGLCLHLLTNSYVAKSERITATREKRLEKEVAVSSENLEVVQSSEDLEVSKSERVAATREKRLEEEVVASSEDWGVSKSEAPEKRLEEEAVVSSENREVAQSSEDWEVSESEPIAAARLEEEVVLSSETEKWEVL